MKKRILSVLILTALFVSLAAACGRTPEPEPTPEPTAVPTPDPHEGMIEVNDGAGGTMWVDEAPDLAPFTLDVDALSVADGRVTYAGEDYRLLRGIDVSDHQKEIDWQSVADSGVDFAIVRCGWRGYGGGSLNEDERYRENIEGAQAAGLRVGAYFFSQATSVMEAAEEAVYTAALLADYDLDLPVFFDWEKIGTEPARTDDVPGTTVTDECLEFCRLLASEGYDTGVYAYLNLAYLTYELDRLEGVTLWLGDPGTRPVFYYDHTFWQYSYTGAVPGIDGDVDLDAMFIPVIPYITDMSEAAAGEAQG